MAGDAQRGGGDQPRLLARRSEVGYTNRLDRALPDEPEAISHDEQEAISQRSRRDWVDARRRRWAEAKGAIDSVLDDFAAGINDVQVQHALRGVRRSAEAVSRRLAR